MWMWEHDNWKLWHKQSEKSRRYQCSKQNWCPENACLDNGHRTTGRAPRGYLQSLTKGMGRPIINIGFGEGGAPVSFCSFIAKCLRKCYNRHFVSRPYGEDSCIFWVLCVWMCRSNGCTFWPLVCIWISGFPSKYGSQIFKTLCEFGFWYPISCFWYKYWSQICNRLCYFGF